MPIRACPSGQITRTEPVRVINDSTPDPLNSCRGGCQRFKPYPL